MGLLHLLILLIFAKMQDFSENSRSWQWALAFAGITFLFGLLDGNLVAALIGAAFLACIRGGISPSCGG